MSKLLALLATLVCGVAAFGPTLAEEKPTAELDQSEPVKVVYHINDAGEQALKALRNISNQMEVAPKTQIVVVAHADGVDFLFEGARDPKSNAEYGALISGLKAQGVRFEVCQVTMKRRNLSKDKFVLEADYTPSGVVRISELQFRNHYAYIKP